MGGSSNKSQSSNGNTGRMPKPLPGEISGDKDKSRQLDLNKPPFSDDKGNRLVKIKTIDGFEKMLLMTSMTKESGWISDSKGNLLAGALGDEGSVYVKYGGDRKGKTFTHNHPDEFGATFSYADAYSFAQGNYKEMRAVAKEGTYRLVGNSKSDYNGFARQLNKEWKSVKAEADAKATLARKKGKSEKEVRMALNDPIDKWYKKNAKKYGISYKFSKSKD